MPQQTFTHVFPNGLTLLAERMEHVRSAAVYFLVPAGCAYDPPDMPGLGGVLSDMISRGAGSRDSRALSEAFDNLGIDSSESAGVLHMHLYGTTMARNIGPALELYADILLRPHLPEDELESCQSLAEQDIQSLEDEPSSRMGVELKKHLYPAPLSNDHRGTIEGIAALTMESIRRQHKRIVTPKGTILSVAGNFEWDALRDKVGQLFGDWTGDAAPPLASGTIPGNRAHVTKEVEQTQIAVAFPSVTIAHPDFYQARGAVQVLSGGMGARLFTEIREKEGLCYSVGASHQSVKENAYIVGSAASLNSMAQRTLDKLVSEFKRLPEGIEQEEVDRVRVGVKTALIMQQESTSARATSLASDWYHLGRVRPLGEIQAAIDGLTVKSILGYLHRHMPESFTVVTLGPSPLTVPA